MSRFLAAVERAEYRGGFRIHLVFNDESEATLDLRRWLKGPVFEPLKDLAYFRRFFVDGGTVVWPNGTDIAPETLYEASRRIRCPKPSGPSVQGPSARRSSRPRQRRLRRT